MHRHKFLRHAAAVLAAAALLVAVVLAGLAAALPDTLYTDGPAAELEIASMPYLTVKKRQGSVAADSTKPDTSANVTLTLFGTLPVSCSPTGRLSWRSRIATRRWAARTPPRQPGCGWAI